MDKYKFINSDMYLGDRYIDDIIFNYDDGEIGFIFNNIRFVEGGSLGGAPGGIPRGGVFVTGAREIRFDPRVCMPNEGIDSLEVLEKGDSVVMEIVTAFTSEDLVSHKVTITVSGSGVYIYDPDNDVAIRG